MFWRARGRRSYMAWLLNTRLIVYKDTQLWRYDKQKKDLFDELTG